VTEYSVTGPAIDLLVISDIHIQMTGEGFPVEDLPVAEHDIVLSLGDVIDENRDHAPSTETGAAYEARGRAFFETLNGHAVPVLAVPGNHDPVACTQRLTDGLRNVQLLHCETRRVSVDDDWSCSIAGWGCEEFDFSPAVLASDYPETLREGDISTPDAIADRLLQAAGQYLAGDLTEHDLAEQLGLDSTDPEFETSRTHLDTRFDTLVDILENTTEPTVLGSHVSPFNVPFDTRGKHSHEGDYHFGSVALRVALAATSVAGCLSGHTHHRGTSAVPTVDGYAYVHNPGENGVSTISIKRDGSLSAEAVDIG
jgi:Icc-related predicted phosphoesterase